MAAQAKKRKADAVSELSKRSSKKHKNKSKAATPESVETSINNNSKKQKKKDGNRTTSYKEKQNQRPAKKLHRKVKKEEETNGKSKLKSKKPKLDHKQWKELTEIRKRKRKPYYDLQKELVALWEKMRQRNIKTEERSKLISNTLNKMKGKISDIAGSHVSSRVLQTCVKYCQPAERDSVYEELRPHFLKLARNTYAVHLLTKMIDNESKKHLQEILSSLHGNVVAFLRHPVASAVVEHVYKLANGSQKQELVSEFYSPEYRLFKGAKGRLVDLLSAENPTKRATILEHLSTSIQPILEKGIVDHSIIHRVLFEYLSVADQSSVTEVIRQLSGPLIVRMIHTKDGSKIGAYCVRNGTAKERKKIVKGMKGYVVKIAQDEHGSVVLLCILSFVDDTSLVNKFIFRELEKDLKALSLDKYGRRCLLQLLCPNVPRYLPQDVLEMLKPDDVTCPSSKIDRPVLDEDTSPIPIVEKEDASESIEELGRTSKKDVATRRIELLLKSGLAQKLIEVCTQNAREFLCSQHGKDVIFEIARGGSEGVIWQDASDSLTSLHRAIADLCALPQQSTSQEKEENHETNNEHIFLQYQSSRTIRKLVLETKVPEGVSAPSFAKILWDGALKGKCKMWAQGHSEKVVTALLESPDAEVKEMAEKELKHLLDANLLHRTTQKH